MTGPHTQSIPHKDHWLNKHYWLVTLVCLCGAIYSSYLLYQDIQNLGARSGSPIAKLEQVESRVKLKPANSFVWTPVQKNERLYPKDSIQSPPNGGASILFNDGRRLEMGENSLIVLDQLSSLSLSFIRGSGILRTESGDSRITLDETGKAKIEKLPVRLVKPESLSELVSSSQTRAVQFVWEIPAKDGRPLPKELTLQISSDRHFKPKSFQSVTLAGSAKEASVTLSGGKYFWRLVSGSDVLGEPSQFRIDTIAALNPLYPNGNQKISIFDNAGGDASQVEFGWNPPQGDTLLEKLSHKIEVARSSDFASVVATQPIAPDSGVAHMKGLPAGPLFWRIVSVYKDGSQEVQAKSPSRPFSLEHVGKTEIALILPEEKANLEMKPQTRFIWSNETPGVNYRWEIRAKKAEAAPLQSSALHEKSFELAGLQTKLVPGAYEWRVRGFVKDQVVGESAWREIGFFDGPFPLLRAPASVSPESGTVYNPLSQDKGFLIHWASVESAVGYNLVIKSGEKILLEKNVSIPALEVKGLKPGKYQYLVRAIDRIQRKGEATSARDFEVTYGEVLDAPEALSPEVQ
jgi:hypothetical protein